MGKKKIRSTKTSKGQHSNVAKSTIQLARKLKSYAVKIDNKLNAWRKGKNPWVTVTDADNPKGMIRRRANDLYGDPKRRLANIFVSPKKD